jgi:type II secretory pathway component PulF
MLAEEIRRQLKDLFESLTNGKKKPFKMIVYPIYALILGIIVWIILRFFLR